MKQSPISPTFQRMIDAVPVDNATFSWEAVTDIFPFIGDLDQSSQDPIHHQEGSVGAHTRMVISELLKDPEFQGLDGRNQFKLFWTAVFHDSGKPGTREEAADGRITNIGHSKLGSMIAREHLRNSGVPFALREEISNLITLHQWPFHLWETNERRDERQQRRDVIKASLLANTDHLLLHARADGKGRVSANGDDIIERVSLTELLFDEHGVRGRPYSFPNDESRVAFFDHEDREPDYPAREDYRCRVTVMCGLPGSGKNHWIAQNRPDMAVVCPDDIRIALGFSATDNQGRVVQEAQEQAKVHLRAGVDFVWNATNVLTETRGKVLRLLRAYNAHIEIIYIEPLPHTLLKQNGDRKSSVPLDAINKMVRKLDPPKPWEAHQTTYVLPKELEFEPFGPTPIDFKPR